MASLISIAIVVHVTNLAAPSHLLRDAQAQAAALFAAAGVTIEWVDDTSSGVHAETRLILLPRASTALRGRFDTVLGAASRTPSGTGTAWVFLDRIAEHADRHSVPLAHLLACAIAHEIGHVLQEQPQHSDHGVMRETWQRADYRRAARQRLRFGPQDFSRSKAAITTSATPH
jgi:hypothetical protein